MFYKKTIFIGCLLCSISAICLAQIKPNDTLQTFLKRSHLTYYEEPHGDLLSNTNVTMPVWAGCAADCQMAACQCSQWQSSQFILDRLSYPPNGYEAGWVGEFRIEYTIDSTGKVRDAEVVNCDAPSLAAQFLKIIPTMPSWTPARNNGAITPIRYYTQFSFSGNDEGNDAAANGLTLRWGNAHTTANNQTLKLTEAELLVVKNEPIRFVMNGEDLVIATGEVIFELTNPKKTVTMDADETLNDEHTSKLSAFIEAKVQKGCKITMRNLSVANPDGSDIFPIADFVILIE
jgi:hypothetical protein